MHLVPITILLAGLLPGSAAVRDNHQSGEYALQLWAMTAEHHRWPTPASEPAVPIRPAGEAPHPGLDAGETATLRTALERSAHCLTGRLIYDEAWKLYAPEFRAGCNAR
ncbi:MAG TPA: hypothetical protein VGS58_12430 [Candidatus Sulfopaludibacter sp.]|nr:hypothetical protein [Candidatus Sulfopaludibacter sp.]